MTRVKLLSPWRRTFQWLTTLTILLLPWAKVDGKSLLRIDIPELSFYFFGVVLRIEELYLMLFVCLALVLGFLLTTLIFGRVWCGWACPQTTLNDVAEWLARMLKLKVKGNRLVGNVWRKVAIQLLYAFLAAVVSANLLWYFIEPRQFFTALLAGSLHWAAWLTLAISLATIYIDLAFIRRLMCSEFCPYGRIQTSLVDPGTLTLHIPATEAARCIECGSCVRACPMEIDIRDGFQIECINCGRCLDACRKVMTTRHEEGLICYSFGTEGHGSKALINPRTLLIALAMVGLMIVLTVAISNRAPATLKISHSHLVAARQLENGLSATFFNAWVNNRTQDENSYQLITGAATADIALTLKGQTSNIHVAGGANQRIDFVLVSPPLAADREIEFILKDKQGKIVATASALIKATLDD